MQEMACYHFEMLDARVRGLPDASATSARRAFPGISDQTIAQDGRPGSTSSSSAPTTRCESSRGSRSSSAWPTRSTRDDDPDERSPRSRRADGGDGGSRRSRTRRSRGSGSRPARATATSTAPGSTTCGAVQRDARLHREARRPGDDIDASAGAARAASASGSSPSTASCCRPTTTARPSTRCCELARTVYPFVENHNFYVEHWHHSIFWNRVRELGDVLADARLPGRRRGHLLPAPLRGARRAVRPAAPAGRRRLPPAGRATGRRRSRCASEIMERAARLVAAARARASRRTRSPSRSR